MAVNINLKILKFIAMDIKRLNLDFTLVSMLFAQVFRTHASCNDIKL